MTGFRVVKAGFGASIQDIGREGYQAYGLSQSGAMDEHSLAWGNYLLHNANKDSVIEMPLGSVSLLAEINTYICTTGADCQFKINHQPAPRYTVIKINPGDTLTWLAPVSGVRAYLAVHNGFISKHFYGSQSVSIRENLGSFIKQGQLLACKDCLNFESKRIMLQNHLPNFNAPLELRLIKGYQFNEFPADLIKQFFQQSYKITPHFDRTGCRLQASTPLSTEKNLMISEGMNSGAVQIPPNGQPIIMMKDHPTMGGYPKIGSVFSLDIAKLAQYHTNMEIKFKPISIRLSQQKRLEFNQFFKIMSS